MSRPQNRWMRRVRRASALVGMAGVVGLVAFPAGAAEGASFSGTAAADGVRIKIVAPGFPATDTPVDAGGPSAQATLDSLGNSGGFAALPYPGDLVISLPDLAAGLVNQGAAGLPPIPLPSLPQYPLVVRSDVVSAPEVVGGTGPYALHAKSTEQSSSATASAGLDLTGAVTSIVRSKADVRREGQTVVAESVSEVVGLALGPLTIGRVTSTARVVQAADGTIEPKGSIVIDAVELGGLPLRITTEGISVFGTNVPLPIGTTLTSLLAGAGINIELQPLKVTETSVVAPALRITSSVDLQQLGGITTAPGTGEITIGAASASMSGEASAPDDLGDIPLGSDGDVAFGSDGLGSGATVDLPSVDLPSVGATGGTPIAGPGTAGLIAADDVDMTTIYLVLVALGLGSFATTSCIRLLGVRLRWGSPAG